MSIAPPDTPDGQTPQEAHLYRLNVNHPDINNNTDLYTSKKKLLY